MSDREAQAAAIDAIAAVNARIDALALAARNEMAAALDALDRLSAALAALEALDNRYAVAIADTNRRAQQRGRHDRPIFAPFRRALAAEMAARLWDASPALCHELGLLPDPTRPRVSNAEVLRLALRGAGRWRIDPPENVPAAGQRAREGGKDGG